MVGNGGRVGGSALPPRELNVGKFVEARAAELGSLHSIVSDRLNNDFHSRRNKRRRTTGHDDRRGKRSFRKKRKVVGGNCEKGDSCEKGENKVSRRVRRRIELKKNPESGFVTSGDGTKRLRTHVWYAKRFTMSKLWGFYLPLGLHGKGRGSRAILKKLKQSVLLHDSSYYGCLQLEGPEGMLISLMNSMLVPFPSSSCEGSSLDILSGDFFGTAMLHGAGKSNNPPIAPVTFMWRRPLEHSTTDAEGTVRRAWVWVHASAFKEAYDALCLACERMTDKSCSVSCVSLEGQFGKLELMGSKVLPLLQKILVPANCHMNSWHLKKCYVDEIDDDKASTNTTTFEGADQTYAASSIIPLIVNDPRSLSKKENTMVPDGKPLCASSPEKSKVDEKTIASSLNQRGIGTFEYTDLWEASKGLCPPLQENVLSMERHHQRKDFYCIGSRGSQLKTGFSLDGNHSLVCPILVLIDGHHEDSVSRCSVILPLSWVKAFWNTLISGGAHAIGLREKRWVSSELGLPNFPWDFPDCSAYSQFMEMEAASLSHKTSLIPPSRRPPELPIPPPWNCVRLSLDALSNTTLSSDSPVEPCTGTATAEEETDNNSRSSDEGHGAVFEGIVARISSVFDDYNLALFPKRLDQKRSLYDFMKNKDFPEAEHVLSKPICGEPLCYLRVLVRAYKEGAFEEGAVVCAPHVSDLTLWTKRLENEGKQLQLPQTSLSSYFVKLQSGEWKIQVPDHQLMSHRWPIGFVTSGFVRGSKKSKAIAHCEAKLLSNLRKEQWRTSPVRRRSGEIFVLVRNLRSTAYRLARATIILEHTEKDLNFM